MVALLLGTVACSSHNVPQSGPSTGSAGAGPRLVVVATTNAWGSIAAQIGGDRVQETSIITNPNPNTDPHSYEPSAADARMVSDATVVVENGIGYDAWADKMLASDPSSKRTVVNVGDTVGVAAGGNPHQWYSPDSVTKVAEAITAAYKKADPNDSGYFDQKNQQFRNQGLSNYRSLIASIKAKYAAIPVGASESIFSPLSNALGLNLITPPEFLKAISEGTDPAPADKATIDHQIAAKELKVYVLNTQNNTQFWLSAILATAAIWIGVTMAYALPAVPATFTIMSTAAMIYLIAAVIGARDRQPRNTPAAQ